jgi:hypothetical protein
MSSMKLGASWLSKKCLQRPLIRMAVVTPSLERSEPTAEMGHARRVDVHDMGAACGTRLTRRFGSRVRTCQARFAVEPLNSPAVSPA